MVLETYPDPLDKLALALESACIAKAYEVKAEGIGEDLRLNLFAWNDHHLVASAQLVQDFDTRVERLGAVAVAAQVLRAGFHADTFTLIMEGFCALDTNTDVLGADLARAFAAGDPNIKECLVGLNVNIDQAHIALTPYTYQVGRIVDFLPPIIHPPLDPAQSLYPAVLHKAIDETDPADIPQDVDTFYDELADGLRRTGFVLTWSYDE